MSTLRKAALSLGLVSSGMQTLHEVIHPCCPKSKPTTAAFGFVEQEIHQVSMKIQLWVGGDISASEGERLCYKLILHFSPSRLPVSSLLISPLAEREDAQANWTLFIYKTH